MIDKLIGMSEELGEGTAFFFDRDALWMLNIRNEQIFIIWIQNNKQKIYSVNRLLSFNRCKIQLRKSKLWDKRNINIFALKKRKPF